jgi:hypothetical protein
LRARSAPTSAITSPCAGATCFSSVASYPFHAYGTSLQFAPGEFNFVNTRAQHGAKEAFRLRDEHFHVPEPPETQA